MVKQCELQENDEKRILALTEALEMEQRSVNTLTNHLAHTQEKEQIATQQATKGYTQIGELEIALQKENILNSDLDSQLKSAVRQIDILNQHIVDLEKEALKTPTVSNQSCDFMPSIFGSESYSSPKVVHEQSLEQIETFDQAKESL